VNLSVGTQVRCEREAAAIGSWSRCAGREGVVVSVNRVTPQGHHPPRFEIGVSFRPSSVTTSPDTIVPVDAWFLPDELDQVTAPQVRREAPQRSLAGATQGVGA
jgi:hypothetical protein